MKTKTKRPRIVKPVFKPLPKADNTEKVSEPIIPDVPDILVKDEFISIPVNPDAGNVCTGCFFHDETEEKCNDKKLRDCTGVIFVKK